MTRHWQTMSASMKRWKQYKAYNRNRQDIAYTNSPVEQEHPEKMFETAKDILNKPKEERIYIKTGLAQFDKKRRRIGKGRNHTCERSQSIGKVFAPVTMGAECH